MKAGLATLILSALLSAADAGELVCGEGAPLNSSLRLDYAVTASRSILSLSGDGEVVFQRKGDAYAMTSSLQALGIFEAHQRSAGGVGKAGLVPRSFSQSTSRRPTYTVHFDWAGQSVMYSRSGKVLSTRPQMQDRLSMVMQLAWRQRKQPQAPAITLPIAGLNDDSDYLFTAIGGETVTVPADRFETVKYERRKDDGDDTLEVWLAPSLCSLPVRLRFTDDKGLVIDQRLRAVQPL